MKSVKVLISGRVQGVWFRAWTMETAQALGLSGWVRNRQDGRVEAVFSGPEAAVKSMLEAVRSGPRLARVDDIETEACDAPEIGFAKLPTA